MIVLRKEPPNEYLKIKYELEPRGKTVLRIKFEATQSDKKVKSYADVNLAAYAGRIVEIDLVQDVDLNDVIVVPIFENNNLRNQMPNRTLGKHDMRIARVAVDDSGEDCVVQLASPSPEIEGFENVVMDDSKTIPAWLMEYSDVAKRVIQKSFNKSKLFKEVNSGDSLAYMEAQLDALTRFVLSGMKDQSALEILNASEKHSVLDSKDHQKLLDEFNHKAKVRKEQKKYYVARERS